MNELVSALKNNYGLVEILGIYHGAGDINSILQLNQAGRRYLVQDGSSISKGVGVLSGVSNDINSVFLHLLEDPRLCDQGAFERPSSIAYMDSARPTSQVQGITMVKSECRKPRHTQSRKAAVDLRERLVSERETSESLAYRMLIYLFILLSREYLYIGNCWDSRSIPCCYGFYKFRR